MTYPKRPPHGGASPVAVWPADFEPVGRRNLARAAFLHAIERTAPEVLNGLYETVLPEFHRLLEHEGTTPDEFNSAEVRDPTARFIKSGGKERTVRNSYFVVLNGLRPHIDAWGARLGLREPPRKDGRGQPITPSSDAKDFYWALRYGDVPLLVWMLPVIGDTLGAWAAGAARRSLRWRLGRAQGQRILKS